MGLIVLWASLAQAQTAPAAQDKAAMERAQREADGPRRRILEAARLKTTVKAAEASPVVQPPAPVPAPVPATASATVTAQRPAARNENAEPEGVMAVLSPAAPPLQVQSASFAMSGITTVAPVALAAPAPSMINVPSRPTTAQPAYLPPPRLLTRVEPELPAYLLRRGARRTELVVDLVIHADGSVSDVVLRDSPVPGLEEPVLEAVRQWRFEPQPAVRQHQVRLVVIPS